MISSSKYNSSLYHAWLACVIRID